ncbi:predicted protein [Botrytis cinerea T4]|uniref:Uncharacterized protein n=1 Tax=Botryotinia fuckeliana (strain T4) TaxID=999810 RepID=G2Y8A0_BOTF4|nr:predicted protein [Botrytis cinerea T4]
MSQEVKSPALLNYCAKRTYRIQSRASYSAKILLLGRSKDEVFLAIGQIQ